MTIETKQQLDADSQARFNFNVYFSSFYFIFNVFLFFFLSLFDASLSNNEMILSQSNELIDWIHFSEEFWFIKNEKREDFINIYAATQSGAKDGKYFNTKTNLSFIALILFERNHAQM